MLNYVISYIFRIVLVNIFKLCHILYFWNLFLLAYFEFDLYSISKVENEGFHGTEDKPLRTDLGFLESGPADVGYWQSKWLCITPTCNCSFFNQYQNWPWLLSWSDATAHRFKTTKPIFLPNPPRLANDKRDTLPCVCIKYDHSMHIYMYFVNNWDILDRQNILVYGVIELPFCDLWLPWSVTVHDLNVYITHICMCRSHFDRHAFWNKKEKILALNRLRSRNLKYIRYFTSFGEYHDCLFCYILWYERSV